GANIRNATSIPVSASGAPRWIVTRSSRPFVGYNAGARLESRIEVFSGEAGAQARSLALGALVNAASGDEPATFSLAFPSGRVKWNVVPRSALRVAHRWPWCASMI